jgi:hypothetical protein
MVSGQVHNLPLHGLATAGRKTFALTSPGRWATFSRLGQIQWKALRAEKDTAHRCPRLTCPHMPSLDSRVI